MLRAIARRTPRNGSIGPTSARILAARCTSAAVTMLSGPVGVTIEISTFRRRASARTAGIARTPAPAPRACEAVSLTTSLPTSTRPTTVPASLFSGAAPVSPSNSTSASPTCRMSPGLPFSFRIRPLCGLGISTMALSVSTETSG